MIKTILIDDELPALEALSYLLRQYPVLEIVGEYTDLEEACQKLRHEPVQLVFLDIQMPTANGLDAARKMRQYQNNLTVVFVTAHNQFALQAFEVDAIDYIVKPVIKRRLDATIEKIMGKIPQAAYEPLPKRRGEFFNRLLKGAPTNDQEIAGQAQQLGLDASQPFSLFFLLPAPQTAAPENNLAPDFRHRRTAMLDALSTGSLLAWETPHGLGILDFSPVSAANAKEEEQLAAARLKALLDSRFPQTVAAIGIAPQPGTFSNFAAGYREARYAALLGIRISPRTEIYHFLDSGLIMPLAHYIPQPEIDTLINNTFGKLLRYDRQNGTELFVTLEAILLNDSLQTVAEKLFIHYKTVLFRKQSIEKILGFSLNSFTGRTTLGVALTLLYLNQTPAAPKE
ncbi:response regulator [Sporomusa sp. GT1]|uniref:response regulator n=1 Tax=Sporomusa sp. GT1 TaxID=1534747 RepID=UPI0016691A0B|nr:response regulator [Sporomusa sp. GT1]